jgi:endonuclease I
MQEKILHILLLTSFISFAQIPVGYYATAENNADDDLKYALNQIIDNHTEFPYTDFATDTWDILKETDRDPNNSSNVILIYSGVSVDGQQEYNSGSGWTREHVWAKSRGDFGTELGPGTDVHALRPLDNSTNSTRSNRGFDNCTDCIDVYDQWSNLTGSKRDNTEWSFEPRDEVKGDVARMIFYMAVRYEGYDSYPDLEVSETILGISDKTPFHGKLSTLLEWHRNDPVDSWEENRNDIIFYNYQNNRNPLIDYPEIVEHLWGNQMGAAWKYSLSIDDFNKISITLYPNPSSNYIKISGIKSKTNINIYDVLGKKILSKTIEESQNNIDVSQLKKGLYFIRIESNNFALKFIKI